MHCIIMAGGTGTRFWPKSRVNRPKQLLDLTGSGKTLLEETIIRIKKIDPSINIHVVTGEKIKNSVKKLCSKFRNVEIIAEPKGRNTAPCIAYMAHRIASLYNPNEVMIILPSDHVIKNEKEFINTIKSAVTACIKNNCFVTIGIKPESPHTGYGYIEIGTKKEKNIYAVKSFREKPDIETAKIFLEDGNYLWNSGMFVVQADVALKEIKRHCPELYTGIIKIGKAFKKKNEQKVFKKLFVELPAESIDYAVMEKLKNILTIKAEFGWNDLGSWTSISDFMQSFEFGKTNIKNSISLNSKGNIVYSSNKKLISLLEVEDLLIVDTEDALLIANKKSEQKIRELVEKIKKNNKEKYL